ncbi:PilW family protein [Pseudomonas abietaniphila]|uniref:PilW family protein n=1 Tax=Pseudomonas abietaniphila TaxID=89065 RepID=UPI00078224A8|nr:prepilin-type N-terminal cleavage/methylation domain-containing protein [Pseudomonas abietaniphila]
MKRRVRGFGLVEIMLALALGLVMSHALMQIFISSKNTYLSQSSAAGLQEDARFVLSKVVQEVRLAGMAGCLATVRDASAGGQFSTVARTPVEWDAQQQSLTLMTAGVGQGGSWHNWEIHTDCLSSATAWTRGRAPRLAEGEMMLPIHKQVYRFNPGRSELALNGQPLISNVRAFSVLFGVAEGVGKPGIARYTDQPDPTLIRSVRLTLTLFDPADRTQEQTFNVVAAIRNRLE